MSSWYVQRLMADERIRDRHEEAERARLARAFAVEASATPSVPGRAPGRERSMRPSAPAAARVRRWTVRLAWVAVTISLDPAARPEARS